MTESGFTPRLVLVATVAAAALALAGCSAAAPQTLTVDFATSLPPAVAPVDSVVWMLNGEPDSLDVDEAGGADMSTVLANVCERLFQIQPDLTSRPFLAESAEWTNDTTLVLTLVSGATFHDGSPITADDVAWSLERHMLDESWEADEFDNVLSVAVTGEQQVTVTFSQPDAVFLQAMAGNGGVILNKKVIEEAGDSFGGPGSPDACSGPYEVTEWNAGERLTLQRSASYWGESTGVGAEEIQFVWGDETAVVNSLKSDRADGVYFASPGAAIGVGNNPAITLGQGPATNAWSAIPTRDGAASDPVVRRALSLVINRTGIAAAAFGGLAQPSKAPIGSGAWGFEQETFESAYEDLTGSPATPSDADIEEARKLLADAGLDSLSLSLVIATDGGSTRTVIANAIADAAKKIGIEASIITFPPQQYGDFYDDESLRAEADLFVDEYYISKNDPVGFYKNGESSSWANFTGWEDPEFDTLVRLAQSTLDDGERAQYAVQLQERWNEEMIWIPLVATPSTVAIDSTLTGIPSSSAYLYYPWAADLGLVEKP